MIALARDGPGETSGADPCALNTLSLRLGPLVSAGLDSRKATMFCDNCGLDDSDDDLRAPPDPPPIGGTGATGVAAAAVAEVYCINCESNLCMFLVGGGSEKGGARGHSVRPLLRTVHGHVSSVARLCEAANVHCAISTYFVGH